MLEAFICVTCGTQYAPTPQPPEICKICSEERQYIPPTGQGWTSLADLQATHMAAFHDEVGLIGIGTSPIIGIGQRALLVPTPQGNILWDCISLIDPVLVALIKGVGGIQSIAISHPHYYTTMLEWSRAFGGIPIHLHAADREWVMRDGPEILFWDGETKQIGPGLTLIRCGGHFEGGQILHWQANGKGALLSGDLLQVVADRKFLGFMRSYPNFIPLGAAAVRNIAKIVEPWDFEIIYGAFWGRVIPTGGKDAFRASVERHIHWLNQPALR